MSLTRYWIPEFRAEEDKTLEYWVDEIEKTFDDSVEAHKISDVEVGSFLSSGVDSSYVACSANVDKTFTVGFDNGTKYNEISYAEELSDRFRLKTSARLSPLRSSGAPSRKSNTIWTSLWQIPPLWPCTLCAIRLPNT